MVVSTHLVVSVSEGKSVIEREGFVYKRLGNDWGRQNGLDDGNAVVHLVEVGVRRGNWLVNEDGVRVRVVVVQGEETSRG